MTIFFIEIELETHQMEISEENVAYSMGKFEACIRLRSLHSSYVRVIFEALILYGPILSTL